MVVKLKDKNTQKILKTIANFNKILLKFQIAIDNHSINSKDYAKAYHEALKEVRRTLVPEKMIRKKNKKIQKITNTIKNRWY